MNKIFKVIWNEARNAYVVVSEIAKNHGSKSCSTKKLLAMLIATGVMTCASFDVLAAQPAAEETAAQQYVALKAADFPTTGPRRFDKDTWGGLGTYSDAKAEWDAQEKGKKTIGNYTYTLDENKYWVRKGYVLTVDENGGKYTPLSQKDVRADVAYTGTDVPKGILQSVTSTVSANGTVTNMGESLNKVTAGSFAGVSHSGGTEVAGSWNYIIQDSSWEGSVDGYVDLIDNNMPKGFITAESNKGLVWDNNKQAYTYKGKAVDYSNVYVIDGEIGVFTNKEGTKVYTGTVYGKNNEILMTVKDANNQFYSYWAAEVTDPSATMATYRVEEYKNNLAVLEENDNKLSRDDIKKVTLDTSKANSAIIGLLRNGGKAVDGAITVTSGGGTDGKDTFVKISNAADTEGKTFATGSKVEAIGSKDATTGITINGEDYTIKSGSKVSVTQTADKKTTIITVDDKATTITDTDTTYTAGNGIAIDKTNKNAISVKLKEGENNLEVTEAGLALKQDLTVNRVAAGNFYMSTAGIGYDDKAYITSSGLNANSQKITGVADGEADTDAVNVSQLKKLSATAKTEVKAGTNIASVEKTTGANGQDIYTINAKDTTYAAGNGITVSGENNAISVKLKDGENNLEVTEAGLELKKDLTVNRVEAGDFYMSTAGIGYGDKAYITSSGLNANSQKITNVKAGEADTDAVNVSQLKKLSATAKTEVKAGINIASVEKTTGANGQDIYTINAKDTTYAAGNGITISGENNAISVKLKDGENNLEVTEAGLALKKDLTVNSVTTNNAYVTNVDASKNESVTNVEYVKNQIADAALSAGDGISITDKKINVKLKEGEQNLVVNQDGLSLNTTLNGMEAINGVGGGKISFSGGNVTINNNVTFNKDGRIQNVTAGTENTDAVNVGQLKDYVAANDTHIKSDDYVVGEVTDSTGNKSQGVSMDIVNKEGNVTGTVTITDVAKASDVGDVNNIASDIKNKEGKTTVVDAVNNLNNKLDTKVGDLQYSKVEKGDIVDGDSTTTAIGKLDQKLTDVAATAAKHTKVEGSSNIIVTNTAKEGEAANYKVELKKDIDVDTVKATTVTTGQTVMNNDGVKVGKDVSVTATAVTAGKTSISDEGVKVDGKTYISANGLNANDKKVTNVADGKVEKDSKDAINGGQLHQAKADINNRIDGVENQVISNSNRINQLGNRVNKVGAGAAALAALHPMDFDPDDKLTFSAGYGNYGGENAAAIGAYYRPDEKVMFSVGGTVGNGENMVNAGVSFALDRTNHVSNSRTALAREVIDLRGQLAVMGAKMAKMEKALGMLDETKTKLFPDIPANHWAYEYIAKLAGNGYIEGYPDGNFGGDRLMTRYEFAAMLYRAIENGAALEEKIIKEFEPELGRIRVDRISGEDGDRDKIERVRVNDTKGERDHYGNKLAK